MLSPVRSRDREGTPG